MSDLPAFETFQFVISIVFGVTESVKFIFPNKVKIKVCYVPVSRVILFLAKIITFCCKGYIYYNSH